MSETRQAINPTALGIEGYLLDNRLYYGRDIPKAPDSGVPNASWTLALHPLEVTRTQGRELTHGGVPRAIGVFHNASRDLLRAALRSETNNGSRPPETVLFRYLSAGVPTETQRRWRASLGTNAENTFSMRPDMASPGGPIYEYNSDGGADIGNTLGVNRYTQEFMGGQLLGGDLAEMFVRGIRERHPDKGEIVVATVLPDGYREEYDLQNMYFANQAARAGAKYGVKWISVKASEVQTTGDALEVQHDDKRVKIDVVNREFKLPGFSSEHDFAKEKAIIDACLEGRAELLGSPLPYSDKLLLAAVQDPRFRHLITATDLDVMRLYHADTAIADPNVDTIVLGDETYTWTDIFNPREGLDLVAKRGGDTLGTTGSKGVIFSRGVPNDVWQKHLEAALNESDNDGSYWVVQRYHQPAEYPIYHIKTSRSKPRDTIAQVRFAPYYVREHGGVEDPFALGGVLVTAGTDPQTVKKGNPNIHGQRHNAYLAVAEEAA